VVGVDVGLGENRKLPQGPTSPPPTKPMRPAVPKPLNRDKVVSKFGAPPELPKANQEKIAPPVHRETKSKDALQAQLAAALASKPALVDTGINKGPAAGKKIQIQMQKKTFVAWINYKLQNRNIRIRAIEETKDGVALANLLEEISQKPLGPYHKEPKSAMQQYDNIGLVLSFLDKCGVKLGYINAADIQKALPKMLLDLVWLIATDFQNQFLPFKSTASQKELASWCNETLKPYGISADSFVTSYANGLALCAIINKYKPELIDMKSLQKDNASENLETAFSTAERELAIPRLLNINEVRTNNSVDERSMILYLYFYYRTFNS